MEFFCQIITSKTILNLGEIVYVVMILIQHTQYKFDKMQIKVMGEGDGKKNTK